MTSWSQIGYMILDVGGFGLFIMEGYPLVPNDYMAAYHKCVGSHRFALIAVVGALT